MSPAFFFNFFFNAQSAIWANLIFILVVQYKHTHTEEQDTNVSTIA